VFTVFIFLYTWPPRGLTGERCPFGSFTDVECATYVRFTPDHAGI